MKVWTKSETETAKVIVTVNFKRGREKVVGKPVVLRPARMNQRDFNKLIKLVSVYGKSR